MAKLGITNAVHLEAFVTDAEYGGPEARQKLEKKLLLKIDLRMSILVPIYILNYMVRNDAAAARARGFEVDLKLKGEEFPTLLSILYIGYILMQIPSNLIPRNLFLNWIGKPSIYLPTCMLVWGLISVLIGLTSNFAGALVTRFFLGIVEAPFFPGALFLLSRWYKRDEIGLRMAILACGNLISNAFGTLLASGILGSGYQLGHAAWRWLFYIEGAVTMSVALIAMFVLPDFPETTKWLSPLERKLALQRLRVEGSGPGSTSSSAVSIWKDWKIYWFALTLTSLVIALSFNAFFPTLTDTLGYGETVSLVLCAPPWIFATAVAFIVSRDSDKTRERFFYIVIPLAGGMAGFVIALSTMNTVARYIALFLMAQTYAGYIVLLAWISNTFIRSAKERAVAIAFINGFSQLGNIAGSYVWPKIWGPTYRNSYAIAISTTGLVIIMALIMKVHLSSVNKQLDSEGDGRGRCDMEKGDPRPWDREFRYIT